MRRFEMREGGSSKFWEIEARGKELVVRFGKIGTDGQTKAKRLASADAAQKEAEKLVREKLSKGYSEIGTKATKTIASEPKATTPARGTPIAALWARIERAVAKRHPGLDLRLRPPAKEKEIAAAEKVLGVRFPDDFRASLLVHDGQDDEADVIWLPYAHRLGSLASLVACWQGDRSWWETHAGSRSIETLDRTKRVRQAHLHPKQIPFAGSRHWDYDRLLLDLVPGPKGREGQVIARDDIDLRPLADTFADFLAALAKEIESGERRPYRAE